VLSDNFKLFNALFRRILLS